MNKDFQGVFFQGKSRKYNNFYFFKCHVSSLVYFNVLEQKADTQRLSLCKKCPYSEFFWPIFSHIWNEYGELPCKCPYLVWMRENTDPKNFKYEHFLHSVNLLEELLFSKALTSWSPVPKCMDMSTHQWFWIFELLFTLVY